ncbi:uncharacterized protein LOC133911553 isoform X2 [Phragmites australis]|uniref:uncharacterized protein LOC133911553 isoform X2 n=1 Tax=Phragmites australis TaxID=29695 RepID=UPI002D77D6B6|nr:uncharacterized protein LOC133911553 isoform X2 [Phragmites australis]
MMMLEEDAIGMAILDKFCIEDISSPIAAHILDFCDDGLGDGHFAAVTTTSDPFLASSEDVSSSTTTTPPLCNYSDETPVAAATAFSPLPSFDSTLTALLEQEQHHDLDTELLPPIDGLSEAVYYPPATEAASIEYTIQMELPDTIAEPVIPTQMSSSAPVLMPLSSGYDECFTVALAGGYMGLDGTLYQQTRATLPNCNAGAPQGGFFNSASNSSNSMSMIGEYQKLMEDGLTRTYSDGDSLQGAFNNTADMQVRRNNQHLINGCNGSPPTLPPTEISNLEDSTFKVARLSPEERKEKIHRYIKKRNKRNFSKKIKYACRKTLADSRPRVHGRFAKNDELCEATRSSSQNQEHYEQTEHMKGEDMLDMSDTLSHLSGLNSYNYKYKCTIESWI